MKEINDYITRRYKNWLDYSEYQCTKAGIPDEACDVLNEVMLSLLSKEKSLLTRLFNSKKNGYTELDYFVLKMIKLNATSPTSPYRSKCKPTLSDENIDLSNLDIIEEIDEDYDKPAEILEKVRKVREALEDIDISDFARRVFSYRFFDGEGFKDWEGKESLGELYDTYNRVQELIRKKINGETIF